MNDTEIRALKDCILNQALTGVSLKTIVTQLCDAIATPHQIYRVSVGMPTLHPLVEAQSIIWTATEGIDMIHSEHGYSEADDWLKSPISFMFKHKLSSLRYNLKQPGDWQQYPLLRELAQKNCTDYYAIVISFNDIPHPSNEDGDGMLVSWVTTRCSGFSDSFFNLVNEIKPALGVACKLADRESTAINIVETYLGKDAGSRVLKGQIEPGELISIDTVIWYSDLRHSTWLAENLSNQDFLHTLNAYFECTAGSVLEHQGEVLRFIGDAVLAIFPKQNFETAQHAATAAWQAAAQAQKRIKQKNLARLENQLSPLNFGLALHAGSLDYGNIGIESRLEFSVIGTVANEVARLEELTKTLGKTILVSESFANLLTIDWQCLGPQPMKGVKINPVIYAPR